MHRRAFQRLLLCIAKDRLVHCLGSMCSSLSFVHFCDSHQSFKGAYTAHAWSKVVSFSMFSIELLLSVCFHLFLCSRCNGSRFYKRCG